MIHAGLNYSAWLGDDITDGNSDNMASSIQLSKGWTELGSSNWRLSQLIPVCLDIISLYINPSHEISDTPIKFIYFEQSYPGTKKGDILTTNYRKPET